MSGYNKNNSKINILIKISWFYVILLIIKKQKSFELNLSTLQFNKQIMIKLNNKETLSEKKEIIFSKVLSCDFCKENILLPNRYHNIYSKKIVNFKQRIIKKFNEFYLIPTLGQLLEHYLLIVSYKHITGSSQLSYCSFDNLKIIMDKLIEINEEKNKKTLFFEHGMPNEGIECFGGCGITHLHIHSIPVNIPDIKKFFNKLEEFFKNKTTKYSVETLSDWSDIVKYKNFSYLIIKIESEVKVFLFKVNIIKSDKVNKEEVPSQLIRQFLKDFFSLDKDYNWRNYNDEYLEIQNTKKYYHDKLSSI